MFSEIWELSESNIGELELEYQAKFPGDPLSVLREILIHVLESTVTEERRRLLMEIIFHKCEFVGEMAVVQQAQRNLCLESYDRIEQTLKHCIEAKMLPADLMTRRAAIIMRGYISGAPRFVTLPLTNNPESDSRNFPGHFRRCYSGSLRRDILAV